MQCCSEYKHIILWTIEGQWTLAELHEAYSNGNAMCAEVPENTINVIVDITRSNSMPSNIFSALSTRVNSEMPNYDMAVAVTNNGLIKAFVNIITSLPTLREKFVVVKTMDDALAFIKKRRLARQSR